MEPITCSYLSGCVYMRSWLRSSPWLQCSNIVWQKMWCDAVVMMHRQHHEKVIFWHNSAVTPVTIQSFSPWTNNLCSNDCTARVSCRCSQWVSGRSALVCYISLIINWSGPLMWSSVSNNLNVDFSIFIVKNSGSIKMLIESCTRINGNFFQKNTTNYRQYIWKTLSFSLHICYPGLDFLSQMHLIWRCL